MCGDDSSCCRQLMLVPLVNHPANLAAHVNGAGSTGRDVVDAVDGQGEDGYVAGYLQDTYFTV